MEFDSQGTVIKLAENETPRFVADVMLGRLTRWLRALGYDTSYDSAWDDERLAHIARAEKRILLTRDVQLTRRRGVVSILIQDDKVLNQLRQVIRLLTLNDALAFTRCIECNAELEELTPTEAAPLVPPFVLNTQTRFRRCPNCGRVYWRGTHWTRMREVLAGLETTDGRA